jgi:hypothetical protein
MLYGRSIHGHVARRNVDPPSFAAAYQECSQRAQRAVTALFGAADPSKNGQVSLGRTDRVRLRAEVGGIDGSGTEWARVPRGIHERCRRHRAPAGAHAGHQRIGADRQSHVRPRGRAGLVLPAAGRAQGAPIGGVG